MIYSLEISYGNIEFKLKLYPRKEYTFGSETIIEVSSSVGSSDGEVSRKIEGSIIGESLGVEYGTGIGSSFDLSDGSAEIKLEVSSGGYERGASGVRVYMVSGLIALGEDAVTVAAASLRASDIISVVRCSQEYVE